MSKFKQIRSEVPLPGDNPAIHVRGLGLEDFSVLITDHLAMVTEAAERYNAMKADIYAKQNLQGFILVLARDFPGLVMEVISLAADEPELKGFRLPIGPQLAAITEIARLTLVDAGGLGNLLAVLGSALRGAGGDSLEESLTQAMSQSSIGGFVKSAISSSLKGTTKRRSGPPRASGTKRKSRGGG
jgi:hypothetical protein